ncbi:hypothetical protein AKO1_010653 [Acrasis kona]|uniref:Uncharacterized protein n=1 Tax=Acrasis kona TaxID=1008807 RepID=A0AAW2YZT1_9EUKA
MALLSSSFAVFNSINLNSTINNAVSDRIQSSTGQPVFTTTDDKLLVQIDPTTTKSLCFNPPASLVGFSSFVLFSFPDVLPSGVITGITLVPTDGTSSISTSVSFTSSGRQQLILQSDTTTGSDLSLTSHTEYLLMLGADADVSFILAQVVNTKQQVVSEVLNYLNDGVMIESILTNKYSICVVTSGSQRRSVEAVNNNSTMQLSFYGFQKMNSLKTFNSTLKGTTTNGNNLNVGAVAGIVIGSVVFFLLVLFCLVLVIIIILYTVRTRKNASEIKKTEAMMDTML